MKRVTVVMATDVGRSPRARLHAEALRDRGLHVTVIGVDGKPTPLAHQDNVEVVRLQLRARTETSSVSRWAVQAALRFGGLGVELARAVYAAEPDLMLVVVPPATPVLDIVAVLARARSTPLVVDWHNLEAAMIALRLNEHRTRTSSRLASSPTRPDQDLAGSEKRKAVFQQPARAMVAVAAAHELAAARGAAVHFGVTAALVEHLRAAGVAEHRCVAFEDAPVVRPAALTPAARASARAARRLPEGALLVMSSSYSLDDDIDFLCTALTRVAQHTPGLHLLLTGDGPRRAEAVQQLAAIAGLGVITRYIDDDDYLTTLGLCDVAVCVHRSASGLDFPFKIRDAAAAGIATVALDTGAVVRAGLARHDVAASTPGTFADAVLQLLQVPAVVTVEETWRERWNRVVWPRLPLSP